MNTVRGPAVHTRSHALSHRPLPAVTRGPTIFIERWLACAESSALAFSPRGALQACNPAARPVFAPGGAPSGALDVSPALRPRWETVNVGGTAWSAVFLQEPVWEASSTDV